MVMIILDILKIHYYSLAKIVIIIYMAKFNGFISEIKTIKIYFLSQNLPPSEKDPDKHF